MSKRSLGRTLFGFCTLLPLVPTMAAKRPLEEIVITAMRSERPAFEAPYTMHVLDQDTLMHDLQVRTVPEALRQIPGVLVQKTAHGQGSPFIRGFTGFRTLFLIDGIRLNNSTFREGPTQYWNTIDPLMIQRLEVVKGPSSVLYGSDAIGGTVNALLISPRVAPDDDGASSRLSYRAASAEDAGVARAQVGFRSGDLSMLAGFSYKDFGDIESGGGLLPKTGYDEQDFDLRVEYDLSDSRRVVFAHQRLDQDDAWRTHSTIYAVPFAGSTVGSDFARVLDQTRDLTYVQFHSTGREGIVEAWNVSVSMHEQDESQFRHRSNNRTDIEGVDVDTLGLSLQGQTTVRGGRWVYGLENYHDSVSSYRRQYNADGSLRSIGIQGAVADDATYDLFGLYAERQLRLTPRWEMVPGIRYTSAEVDANRVQDPETGAVIGIAADWNATVGSVRFRYVPADGRWNVFSGVSQGFRAPNLSDLTRLDIARTNELEIPVTTLDAEKFISYEVGVKIGGSDAWLQAAYYYTDIENMIVRTPTGRIVNGLLEVTKQNAAGGFTSGVEIDGAWDFSDGVTLLGAFTWARGELDSYPTSAPVLVREPIGRSMPVTTLVGLRFEPAERYWFEVNVLNANGQDKLSTSDQGDTQRIPPGGTPGYTVLNLRSSWEAKESLTLSAAIENVTDQNYRVHGSGLNEPGRNVVLTLDWGLR